MRNYIPALTRLAALPPEFPADEVRFLVGAAQQGLCESSTSLQAHLDLLGPALGVSGCWDWDKGDYGFTYNEESGERTLLVAEDADLGDIRQAVDAYLWDIGRSKHTIPRAEWQACRAAGLKHAESRGEALIDAEIGALSHQEPKDDQPGDAVWERLQTLPFPSPGKQHEAGGPPPTPNVQDLPHKPEQPDPPAAIEPDAEHLARLERAIEWERTGPTARDEYLAAIEAQNRERLAEFEAGLLAMYHAKLETWKEECLATHQQNLQRDQEHQETCRQWEAGQGELRQRQAEWIKRRERNEACAQGFNERRLMHLGCIWETTGAGERTTLPRGVNGYPMFMSCHLMHKDDLARVRVAVNRERQRREEIEV